ncbi:hypothetical protein JVU11DRAFT_6792 [Chiua virens]|nr:hypothetical protein JVU11DRAFT_6792 [Chiua virens]
MSLNSSSMCVDSDPGSSSRRQYRLVCGVVGRALLEFECTKQLATAVLDALQAHAHALEVVHPLHHDISAWNIILTDENRGILIDWDTVDLEAESKDSDRSTRHDRMTTYQFRPLRLTRKPLDPDKIHPLTDDLESFLRVLIWATLDRSIVRNWGFKNFFPPQNYIPRIDTPFKQLLMDLCAPFQSLYGDLTKQKPRTDEKQMKDAPPNNSDDDQSDEDMRRLRSFDYFIDTIRNALDRDDDDWPMNDDKRRKC